MQKSLTKPETIQRNAAVEPTSADPHDPDDYLPPSPEPLLTDDERAALMKELGRA